MSQSDPTSKHDALIDLFWDYLHGRLDADAAQALEQALFADEQAAAACKDLVETMVLAKEAFQSENAALDELKHLTGPDLLKELARREQLAQPELVDLTKQAHSFEFKKQNNADPLTLQQFASAGVYLLNQHKTKAIAFASLAAAILLAFVLMLNWGEPQPDPIANETNTNETPDNQTPAINTASTFATLTATHNAVWAERALAPGSQLRAGERLTLTAGFAEITTKRGAIAILQAPATIELLDNDNALHLHTGKLVGLCHTKSSKGFLVKTDHADIMDLGTEFGVQVAGDYVDVSVFVGEVELTTHDGEVHPLTTNQTAKLKVNGNNRDVAIQDHPAEGFARRLPRPALVTGAWINDDRFKVEVAHQAVREDVRLFSDRVHEINGIDASGLPTVLLGGDIIRTPADARATFNNNTEGLRVHAELFAPADLYVLYSTEGHKRNYPDWLTRDYTLTTIRVGLDAGPFHDQTDEQTFVGPGNGIDEQMLVWKRNQPAMGRLEVSGHMTDAVYSIVAVPAQQAGLHD